jgi:hypothetical protein
MLPKKLPNFTATGFAPSVLPRCCAKRMGRGVEEKEKGEKMKGARKRKWTKKKKQNKTKIEKGGERGRKQ